MGVQWDFNGSLMGLWTKFLTTHILPSTKQKALYEFLSRADKIVQFFRFHNIDGWTSEPWCARPSSESEATTGIGCQSGKDWGKSL